MFVCCVCLMFVCCVCCVCLVFDSFGLWWCFRITVGSEACDDGNTALFDGCSDVCAVEGGYTCVENAALKSSCSDTDGCATNTCRVGSETCVDRAAPFSGFKCECANADKIEKVMKFEGNSAADMISLDPADFFSAAPTSLSFCVWVRATPANPTTQISLFSWTNKKT